MRGSAVGGADVIFGDSEDDEAVGDASELRDRAVGGDDQIHGGVGNDFLDGDARTMFGNARGGDDVLLGGRGNDVLAGNANPSMSALASVTRGADRFVFATGSGRDAILDFEDGKDVIDLRPFDGIDTFGEVRAQATRSGTATVLDLGAAAGGGAGTDVVTLNGFSLAQLNAADFLFA
jgi:Ca2+-binding RTX toxin-like protein